MSNKNKIEKLFAAPATASVYIIGEIGINHNGSLATALRLIDAAHQAGVDAVKFQKRNLAAIYSKKILGDPSGAEWNFDYLIPLLQKFELSAADYAVIKKKCQDLELDLIVTPFDEDSAEFIQTLDLAAFKIASADMTNLSLIKKCASYNRPLIISTGMWSEKDIETCVDFYKKNNLKFALLLANSTYPCPYESLSLLFLNKLKTLSAVVGYSGHERGIFIPIAAVALGAKIVEKHITFDRDAEGPDHKASLLPEEFMSMVDNIRMLEKALGTNKEINQAEKLNKEVFAKSAVACRDIKKGHLLYFQDLIFQSPGKGIFPHEIENYYGLPVKRDIASGEFIAAGDFVERRPLTDWKKFEFSKKWGVKCRFHDFQEYKVLNSQLVEFHCSQKELSVNFMDRPNPGAELIVHAPEIVDNQLVDICSSDEVVVARSIDILQQTIDKTLAISKNWSGAKPKMVAHLGGMLLNSSKQTDINREMMARAIKNFKRLKYSPAEIDILPENLPPRPWYLGGEWHQYGFAPTADFLEFCGQLDLGMTLDICHAALYCNLVKISLRDYVQEIKHLVRHVHISDAKSIHGEGLQIGDGDIDFLEVFKELKDINFSWVTEIWSGHLHQGAGTYQALLALEQYNKLI